MSSSWYFSVMQICRFSTKGMDVTFKKFRVNLNVLLASKMCPKKNLLFHCFPPNTTSTVQEISNYSQGELLFSAVGIEPHFVTHVSIPRGQCGCISSWTCTHAWSCNFLASTIDRSNLPTGNQSAWTNALIRKREKRGQSVLMEHSRWCQV